MNKISIIVPSYNEEKTIKQILDKIFAVDIDKEVIVVDDASTDSTLEILNSIHNPALKIVSKPENGGKGSAVRYGLSQATGDYVIIQDADLEYDPADYALLLKPLLEHRADVVYGDRFPLGRKNMFLKQFLANKFLTLLTNLLYKGSLKDMETCYKIIPLYLLKSLELKEENFDIEAEVTAKLLSRNLTIINVPIHYIGRSYAEGKKIGFKDFLAGIKILWKYRKLKLEINEKC